MRIGLRCTSLPRADNRATLSRTSSAVSVAAGSQSPQVSQGSQGSQGPQERGRPMLTRTLTSQSMRPTTVMANSTAMHVPQVSQPFPTGSVKRLYSENPPDTEHADRMKRRQMSTSHDAHSPSLLRRESSLDDTLASPWTPAINRSASWSHRRTPNSTRLSSGPPRQHLHLHNSNLPACLPANDVDEPPPRRQLPAAITRHISQPSSQVDETSSRSASSSSRKVAVAEVEVQTERPFVEPEVALFSGMGLFQELSVLKDTMIKECLNMTKSLGGNKGGSSGEAEARLAARYAIDFQSRFIEICAQHTNSSVSGITGEDTALG